MYRTESLCDLACFLTYSYTWWTVWLFTWCSIGNNILSEFFKWLHCNLVTGLLLRNLTYLSSYPLYLSSIFSLQARSKIFVLLLGFWHHILFWCGKSATPSVFLALCRFKVSRKETCVLGGEAASSCLRNKHGSVGMEEEVISFEFFFINLLINSFFLFVQPFFLHSTNIYLITKMCEAWGLAIGIQVNMLSPLKGFIVFLFLLPLISILIAMFFCSVSWILHCISYTRVLTLIVTFLQPPFPPIIYSTNIYRQHTLHIRCLGPRIHRWARMESLPEP